MKEEKNNKKEKPNAHQAYFRLEVKGFIQTGDKPEELKLDYEVKITVERVEYVAQMVAGVIARAASKVAGPAAAPVEATAAS